ncbi:MAG: aldo/keto reductase [Microbacterium sp.]
MKTTAIPRADLTASSIVLGCMRIRDMSDADIRALYDTSREAGIDMFDHADIYGGDHACERRFGEAIRLSPTEREEIVIQSKVGIRNGFWDFSAEHILASVDTSLAALKTDYLDILLLHRPDTLMEPDEIAGAFQTLHDAGKVRHFGVSNQTPGQIELLQRSVAQPLVANQVQLSIAHANLFAQGVAANMDGLDQSIDRDGGLLEYARLNGITLQAWSPFQQGFFRGPFVGDRENYAELNDVLDELAARYEVDADAIAVAWLTRHPADIQVVVGTTSPDRVRSAAAGSDLRLSREEWYRLFTAAGHTLP